MNWEALAFLLLVLALALRWLGRHWHRDAGLPRGRVIYVDTGGWKRPTAPLIAPSWGLVGKPDYLIADGPDIIPVELKSHHAPPVPYASHLLQLAAYCTLVEATYGRRPAYGVLRYADRTFEIPYTPELEARLRATLAAIREAWQRGEAARNHHDLQRCRACLYRQQCPEALL